MQDQQKVGWMDVAAGVGKAVKEFVKAVADVVYSDTAKDYAARGGAEVANALFTGNAYGPGSSVSPTVSDANAAPQVEAPAIEPDRSHTSAYITDDVMRNAQYRGNDNDRGMGMSR